MAGMSNNIVFLTRTYKPNSNIGLIKYCLRGMFYDSCYTFRHVIIVDTARYHNDKDWMEYEHRNTSVILHDKMEKDTQNTLGIDYALETLPINDNDYVYVLDDDNIIHPRFIELLQKYVKGEDVIVFQCEERPELGKPQIMAQSTVGRIDWCNFLTKARLMRELKVYDPAGTRCEDGLFFNKVKYSGCNIKFIEDEFAFYNKLKNNAFYA